MPEWIDSNREELTLRLSRTPPQSMMDPVSARLAADTMITSTQAMLAADLIGEAGTVARTGKGGKETVRIKSEVERGPDQLVFGVRRVLKNF